MRLVSFSIFIVPKDRLSSCPDITCAEAGMCLVRTHVAVEEFTVRVFVGVPTSKYEQQTKIRAFQNLIESIFGLFILA